MLAQLANSLDRILAGGERLGREPFVDDKRIVAVAVVENVECSHTLVGLGIGQRSQCRKPVGHVVGRFELSERQLRSTWSSASDASCAASAAPLPAT